MWYIAQKKFYIDWPQILDKNKDNKSLIESVCAAKLKEIRAGVDGFLVKIL
jgi:hypothetical protein